MTSNRQWLLPAVLLPVPAVLLIARFFFFQPFDSPSTSMAPTINLRDYFLVSLRAYAAKGPERGDVIVFHTSGGDFVKRVAGIPGDHVRMVHGQLVLNGKPVLRRRVEDFVDGSAAGSAPVRQYEETLPSGRRYRTIDIVDQGPADDTDDTVVPPDGYFVLGDNRDNSDDSRLDVGFVHHADLVGRVAVKFFDGRRGTPVWAPVN
jgi:signal peptidase I